jgi:hypothetical protein
MVRYPHTGILVTPGETTWIKGKASLGKSTEETVECEVQPDNSQMEVSLNGKSIIAKYKVFLPIGYESILSARMFRFRGMDYNILQAFPNQHNVTMKIG